MNKRRRFKAKARRASLKRFDPRIPCEVKMDAYRKCPKGTPGCISRHSHQMLKNDYYA